MKNHYIPTSIPELSTLAEHYNSLFTAMTIAETALNAVNSAKSERIDNGNRPREQERLPLYLQRETIYEAALIWLQDELQNVRPLLEPVRLECEYLRKWLRTTKFPSYELLGSRIRANIIFAEWLYEAGCVMCVANKSIVTGSTIAEQFEREAEERREWVVKSSGHGSAFRFDGGNGKRPPPRPYMTEKEANAEAYRWIQISDPIGGDAIIHNVYTGQEKTVRNPADL